VLRVIKTPLLDSVGFAPGKLQCTGNGCSAAFAAPAALDRRACTQDAACDISAHRFDHGCSTVLAAVAAPPVQSHTREEPGTINAWNVDAVPFIPDSGCCEVDWESFIFDVSMIPPRKELSEPRLLDDDLPDIAIPTSVHIHSTSDQSVGDDAKFEHVDDRKGTMAVHALNTDLGSKDRAESSDESKCDSDNGIQEGICALDADSDEEFWQEAPCGSSGWYVKLVPERYVWEPTVGIGEREWIELVQELAITARKMIVSFYDEAFPVRAARRLLAILTVQDLQAAWAGNGFATLFSNRFRHPDLVYKGIEVIAQSVSESFVQKKAVFIEKGIVGELLACERARELA
jgi:hypothetical protein